MESISLIEERLTDGGRQRVGAAKVACMWRMGVLLIAFVPSCFAASGCPDLKMREAVVGGDSINGVVTLQGKAVKSALVSLNSVKGKFARGTTTDKNGAFTLYRIPPGKYSLTVYGWGRIPIQVDPKADRDYPQKPNWSVTLTDNGCISTGVSMD